MKRAILIHRTDFAAVVALVVAAFAVAAYILRHQPAFTFGRTACVFRATPPSVPPDGEGLI